MCVWTGRVAATQTPGRQAIDYLGGALLFGLTILATLLLDQKVAEVVGSANRLALGVVLVMAVVFFIRHEKRHSSPLISLSVFVMSGFSTTSRLGYRRSSE